MGKNQTQGTLQRLISYWQLHRRFDANIAGLARYARVSRDTVYRWLNKRAVPGAHKLKLIREWLQQRTGQQ